MRPNSSQPLYLFSQLAISSSQRCIEVTMLYILTAQLCRPDSEFKNSLCPAVLSTNKNFKGKNGFRLVFSKL